MDDFTRIKGIGEARAKALKEAGFGSYEDLEKATDGKLLEVLGDEEVVKNVRNFLEGLKKVDVVKARFLYPVKMGKRWFAVGDEVELKGGEAKRLIKMGVVQEV